MYDRGEKLLDEKLDLLRVAQSQVSSVNAYEVPDSPPPVIDDKTD